MRDVRPRIIVLGLGLLVIYLVAMAAVLFGAAGTLAVRSPATWATCSESDPGSFRACGERA